MDVIDRCLDRSTSLQVPVVTRTFLPESEANFARTFIDDESIFQWRRCIEQLLFDELRERLFDESQITTNLWFGARGDHDQMHVFWHKYESRQIDLFLL